MVVVGEDPYAEGSGDRAKLELARQDLALVDAAKRSGKPVVVVLLPGGRSSWATCWTRRTRWSRPGCRAPRATGSPTCCSARINRPGKLSCSWPANMSQIPINVGDPRAAPLFPYGFGLSW